MSLLTALLGYPRIGAQRQLKVALENYWAGKGSSEELLAVSAGLRSEHWKAQRRAGIDIIPSNDFSYYDTVLDTAVMVGAVPKRYRGLPALDAYFAMARGAQQHQLSALPMKKWFDTNYHYIVPEIEDDVPFVLNTEKLATEEVAAREEGLRPRPVILGPVTFLSLSQNAPLHRLDELLAVYGELLAKLADGGVEWVQLDEPALVLDLSAEQKQAYRTALQAFFTLEKRPKLMLTTYFGGLRENLDLLLQSPPEGLHLDLVRAPEGLEDALRRWPQSSVLSLGLVDGRNIWHCDLEAARKLVDKALEHRPADSLQVATSCSLLHTPYDLNVETGLDDELRSWMAFAEQKKHELVALAKGDAAAFEKSRQVVASRKASRRLSNAGVRQRLSVATPDWLQRSTPFAERIELQKARFGLPALPTTTIGSFPQTAEIRKARAEWRAGKLADAAYEDYLRAETADCIKRQEALGLDVLVHGEYERTDMVEYFGQHLEGFAFTQHGWVQSYGSRCVKPPVLFGDVSRRQDMTVGWSAYAQSLTEKPVKGMLTGPVTILQWSFVRDDQPRSETCRQIGLALRDEVQALEGAGIGMIQVDEPAIREGLPLRKADWAGYLQWAVDCFRLSTSGVKDDTQIHTHMCYSEFSDILDAVQAMDSDVLFIETSRSKMELLSQLEGYRNDVGPGIYDIHSPRVPSTEEMIENLERALARVNSERVWVNPDCGLKTRGWPEVEGALSNLVQAARELRSRLATPVSR